jgi:hypothetical protein
MDLLGLEVYRIALPAINTVADRLIDINITVADLQVVTALRVGADPRLIVNRRALVAEVRERHKISGLAFLAFGKT